jgi:hypothetical protein
MMCVSADIGPGADMDGGSSEGRFGRYVPTSPVAAWHRWGERPKPRSFTCANRAATVPLSARYAPEGGAAVHHVWTTTRTAAPPAAGSQLGRTTDG